MRIGFDLDKVFINHPPFIPAWLMHKLYGEKANGHLSYRIPGKFEQFLRQLSHASFLRPAIQKNLDGVQAMQKKKHASLFLISSRYNFLQKQTSALIKKYHLENMFEEMSFNFANLQPHVFKEKLIGEKKLDRFVDDDLPLIHYLAKKYPQKQFFWLNEKESGRVKHNIIATTDITSVFS